VRHSRAFKPTPAATKKVDEREHVVTHAVIQSLLPNWVGTEQRRQYKFKDYKLILRRPPILIGGSA
jgi:hypothetical protein